MSDPTYLNWFREHDGSTSWTTSQNAGQYEHAQGWKSAPQQSWESADAYTQRINSNPTNWQS